MEQKEEKDREQESRTPTKTKYAFDPATVNRSEVSRALKVDVAHVSRVLNGQKNPSMKLAAKMASYLGVTLDQFYACVKGQQAKEQIKTRTETSAEAVQAV